MKDNEIVATGFSERNASFQVGFLLSLLVSTLFLSRPISSIKSTGRQQAEEDGLKQEIEAAFRGPEVPIERLLETASVGEDSVNAVRDRFSEDRVLYRAQGSSQPADGERSDERLERIAAIRSDIVSEFCRFLRDTIDEDEVAILHACLVSRRLQSQGTHYFDVPAELATQFGVLSEINKLKKEAENQRSHFSEVENQIVQTELDLLEGKIGSQQYQSINAYGETGLSINDILSGLSE